MKLSRIFSLVAGGLAAIGLLYVGLAQIWNLPMADQINQTIGVIVQFLSAMLAVITGKKVGDELKGQTDENLG